jgi:hypothetical protein
MANYSIKRLTDEELADHRKQFPDAGEPEGPWEFKDGNIRIGLYPTEEAAKKAQAELERDEEICDLFDDWAEQTAYDHGMEPSEVEKLIRGHLQ